MDNNWIVENLTNAFTTWNSKMTEMWSLLTESPQTFKGGTIWQTIVTINGGMQAIGYGLLVLFFAIGIFRSASGFRDFQRPEHLLRHFIYFVLAKLGITYGKVRSTGMGGISADDDRAVEKLEAKLAGLEAMQEEMKTVNAYYRKHKTLEGCPVLSAEEIGKLQSSMASDWRKNPVPYPSYLLTNNNANIRRTRQRIEDLKSQSEYAGWAFPGGRAEINEGENRLQLFFEEKPSEEQRREMKSNGFKWAPSQGAWQRQLTKNAIYAAGRMEFLRPEDGQSPYQLQPFARKTEKDMTR